MNPDVVVEIGQRALETALWVAAPMLVASLVVGLLVSIFQAVTQIHEMTLTFVPKILAVFVVLSLAFPWMLQVMIGFTSNLIQNLATYAH